MRGTPFSVQIDKDNRGIIPAHAGNTGRLYKKRHLLWDHPRACGEHCWKSVMLCDSAGSSPRMRGTPSERRAAVNGSRIIPAHAGNTGVQTVVLSTSRDHPRACGEHPIRLTMLHMQSGSSPRMRGTPCQQQTVYRGRGIIPAHAGNTCQAKAVPQSAWDHPRACGEHVFFVAVAVVIGGSSPRMRGTLHGWGCNASIAGIIPAHAGNTEVST